MSILGRLGFSGDPATTNGGGPRRLAHDGGAFTSNGSGPGIPYRPTEGEGQYLFHSHLVQFNAKRLSPAFPDLGWMSEIQHDGEVLIEEGLFVERERRLTADQAAGAPTRPETFVSWFERLGEHGPRQDVALLPWLSSRASLADMTWFLRQESAGEAAVDDLVAITQVRFPNQPKLEMARTYWDEMGRGQERGVHGAMLAALTRELGLAPGADETVWESLALSNLMVALAANRRYAYHAVGALGAVVLTAPKRFAQINAGLRRLGISTQARMYFQMNSDLDIDHSTAWHREVILPLVQANPAAARAIAEGAVMRQASRARCDRRYRRHFKRGG